MKATQVLMNEHKEILRALHILEQMGERAMLGEVVLEKDCCDLLEFLDLFGDQHHQGREEAVLFPAMMRNNPENCGKLRHMAFEHDQERSLVQGLQEAVRTRKAKDFAYYAERLVHVLRTHIYKEDHILFEIADSGLTPEQDEQVAKELARYEPDWDANVKPRLLARLRDLELKYLGRCSNISGSHEEQEAPQCEFR